MKAESIVLAAAGAFFGLIVGWMIGTQQAGPPRQTGTATPAAQTAGSPSTGQAPTPTPVDENRAQTLRATALQDPKNTVVRVELGNMYMDANRPADAVTWYEEALKITPRDVNVSTDLGVCYHYLGDADRALKQFAYSLSVDPNHLKTMLNMGVVRAFGKQDLAGAAEEWERLLKLSPESAEGQAAKRFLDGLKSAHPDIIGQQPAGPPKGGA